MGKIKPQSKIRQPYYIGVVATMSSGKSTLLNALIGEELLHTANEATTAKIQLYFVIINLNLCMVQQNYEMAILSKAPN